ncbi:LAME_0A07866g1_1 [Lachancea meyersii CBS 8951]|uniref:LAME_0A07866g1_1 n=1 Tax=Lachancea meyersii CBS 8951 TaxID=1266667 RepID=A0A1G4IRI0_9SACH|nr:LAME_0A07866g1_1 [Lachancea meyersii CBS 8951]
MVPATPPRSRNRRGKGITLEPPRPDLVPMSPQHHTQASIPVTPGSVGAKPSSFQFNKLRSPRHRSPIRGLRTPEYTPVKPSESARKKLDFGEETQEFRSVGRVLFPESNDGHSDRFQSRFLAPAPSTKTLQKAPQLLPPDFSSIMKDPLCSKRAIPEIYADAWETDESTDSPRKGAKQTPGTPSDKIVTFELAKDWNNNSGSCLSSDEEDEETMIKSKSLKNPFESGSTPSEETRQRRKQLLLAENPDLESTIQYMDKKGKVVEERHLSSGEQERYRPRMLFADKLGKGTRDSE